MVAADVNREFHKIKMRKFIVKLSVVFPHTKARMRESEKEKEREEVSDADRIMSKYVNDLQMCVLTWTHEHAAGGL